MSEKEKMNTQNKKEISGFLKGVEIIGNKLPHPAMLFLLLAVIVVIISHFVAAQGVSVTYFDARAKAEVTKKGFFVKFWGAKVSMHSWRGHALNTVRVLFRCVC